MINLFFAKRVESMKTNFDDVPNMLKQRVAEILIQDDKIDLITDEEYLNAIKDVNLSI